MELDASEEPGSRGLQPGTLRIYSVITLSLTGESQFSKVLTNLGFLNSDQVEVGQAKDQPGHKAFGDGPCYSQGVETKDIEQDSGDGQLPRQRDEPKETKYDVVLRHRRLRVNSVQILQRTQILRGGRAMMDIPLCRMIGLQVVRPAVDIEKLKADFVHGYRLGAAVFYVSIMNFVGSEREVLSEDRALWDRHWQRSGCKEGQTQHSLHKVLSHCEPNGVPFLLEVCSSIPTIDNVLRYMNFS